MPFSAIPAVGERVREERSKRGLSVRGLARAVGVSPSLISQIETGRSRPSVSTLYGITRVLGITLEDVFGSDEATADAPLVDGQPAPPPAGVLAEGIAATITAATQSLTPAATAASGRVKVSPLHLGPIVRPEEREVLELDSGVTWERLGRVPGVHVDFLLVTYTPGGSSSSSGQLMRHAGVEFGHLCDGELILTLGFDDYKLTAGDAVSFPSSTPHRYRNDGARPAVGVWFQPNPS